MNSTCSTHATQLNKERIIWYNIGGKNTNKLVSDLPKNGMSVSSAASLKVIFEGYFVYNFFGSPGM